MLPNSVKSEKCTNQPIWLLNKHITHLFSGTLQSIVQFYNKYIPNAEMTSDEAGFIVEIA